MIALIMLFVGSIIRFVLSLIISCLLQQFKVAKMRDKSPLGQNPLRYYQGLKI